MTTKSHDAQQQDSRAETQAASRCEGHSCQTGICSPCVLVWGVIAVWMLLNALWGALQ